MKPGIIVLSGTLAASDSDVLSGTRLQTVPSSGVITVEAQASDNDATNNFAMTMQLPNGDTPFDAVRVPAGVTAGALNVDDKLQFSMPVAQGGHVTLGFAETGTATLAYRVTFTPV